MEAALIGLAGVVVGSILTHWLGGRRERQSDRRAWNRAQLGDAAAAVGALVDLSNMEPLGIGLPETDEQAQASFTRYADEFDECRRAIRLLLLHSDETVRETATTALWLIWPALNHAYALRFGNGVTAVKTVQEAWGAMAAAASDLAAAVRRAAEAA